MICYCVLTIGAFFGLNWIYQVIRKPVELLAPVSTSFLKSPESFKPRFHPQKCAAKRLGTHYLEALCR